MCNHLKLVYICSNATPLTPTTDQTSICQQETPTPQYWYSLCTPQAFIRLHASPPEVGGSQQHCHRLHAPQRQPQMSQNLLTEKSVIHPATSHMCAQCAPEVGSLKQHRHRLHSPRALLACRPPHRSQNLEKGARWVDDHCFPSFYIFAPRALHASRPPHRSQDL